MKPSQLAAALRSMIEIRQPCFVWGPPGIGKSQIVAQVAASMGREILDLRMAQLDPVDLRGLPTVVDGRSSWAIPDFLPRGGTGVVFLDELNRAPMMVQNAGLQFSLDFRIGEYILPPEWAIVAAGNRESDGGGVSRLISALGMRFVHLDLAIDVDEWCKWAVKADLAPETIAFIRFRPDLLHQYDPRARANPSPRTWEFVSRITQQKPTAGIEHALVSGAVGDESAIEYTGFLRLYRELPSIDQIMLNPATAPVPTSPASLYAVASAIARRCSPSNVGRAIAYLDRIGVEYAVMAIRDATDRDQTITSTGEFTKWAISHSDIFA